MTTIEIASLTPTKYRLLCTLVTPMTSAEVFSATNVKYPYGIRMLSELKKEGLISTTKKNGKDYYYTIRTVQTLSLFNTSVGKTTEYQFPFAGKVDNFYSAIYKLRELRKRQETLNLPEYLLMILSTLRIRAYRTRDGMDNQVPDEFALKRDLTKRITQEELLLRLAKEILNAPIWSGKPEVFDLISSKDLSDAELTFSDQAYKRAVKGLIVND